MRIFQIPLEVVVGGSEPELDAKSPLKTMTFLERKGHTHVFILVRHAFS